MSLVDCLNSESQIQPTLPDFLEKLGIFEDDYQRQFLAQDCSTRWYERLIFKKPLILGTKDHEVKQAVLMHIPEEDQGMAQQFLSISKRLANIQLRVPEIYAHESKRGLFLLEDFGDKTYQRLLYQGYQPLPLYQRAVDVLIHLHHFEIPSLKEPDLALFDLSALLEEVSVWADWYYPFLCKRHLSSQEKASFLSIWHNLLFPLEETFTSDRVSLVLKDYHADNLMDCSGEDLQRCGLLDFQDALYGPTAYDLVSLLEDARLDIDPELAKICKGRYVSAQPASFNREAFEHEYLLLGAQRATKILGIFARLSLRDQKPQYLQHLPRVWRYLESALEHALFDELRYSFDQLIPRSMRSLF